MGDISERQARTIKPVIKEVTAEIKTKIEAGADPIETTCAVSISFVGAMRRPEVAARQKSNRTAKTGCVTRPTQ